MTTERQRAQVFHFRRGSMIACVVAASCLAASVASVLLVAGGVAGNDHSTASMDATEPAGTVAEPTATGTRSVRQRSRIQMRRSVFEEPRHDGRTAREWIDALSTPEGREGWRALHAIEALGLRALRQMVERFSTLDEDDLSLPAVAQAVGSTMCSDAAVLDDVVRLATGTDLVAQRRALDLLSRYAWNAYGREGAVLARLSPLLRSPDPETRILVLRALDRLDDAALPVVADVIALSGDPDAQVRAAVLEAHLSSAPGWSDMVVRALADPDVVVRTAACEDVRRTGPRQPRVVMERVAVALSDADRRVRAAAARALAQSAWGFEEIVVPPLLAAVEDDASGIALQATNALVKLDRADAIPLERVIELLRDPETRWAAAEAAGQRGVAASAALPELIAGLDDPEPLNAGYSARALRAVGPGEESALPGIVRLLERPRSENEGYARAYALEALEPYGERAAPALSRALTDSSESIRRKAAAMLIEIGEGAVQELARLLTDPDSSRRVAALRVLAKIQPASTASLASDLLEDEHAAVRTAAVEALAASRREVARFVAAFTDRLTDSDAGVRVAAARALGAVDPLPDSAHDALRRASRDEDRDVRSAATLALQRRSAAPVANESTAFDGTEVGLGEWVPDPVLRVDPVTPE